MKLKNLKHGDKVTCVIKGVEIKDAMISIDKSGNKFICQNERYGKSCENKLGYAYSWYFDEADIKRLKINKINKTIKDVEEGDIIKNGSGKIKVLGIAGQVYFLSEADDYDVFDIGYSLAELENYNYKIYQEETEELKGSELTDEEVLKLVKDRKLNFFEIK